MWKRVQKWPLGAGIFHNNASFHECQAAAAPCWSRRRVVGAAVVIPAVRNCPDLCPDLEDANDWSDLQLHIVNFALNHVQFF